MDAKRLSAIWDITILVSICLAQVAVVMTIPLLSGKQTMKNNPNADRIKLARQQLNRLETMSRNLMQMSLMGFSSEDDI